MSEQAAFLSDWVIPPEVSVRQWVISFPMALRFWMAKDHSLLSSVLSVYIRALAGFQRKCAKNLGFDSGESGAVTFVQRFGGSGNLNPHFHTLMIEGVYREVAGRVFYFKLKPPTDEEVQGVLSTIQKRVVRLLIRLGYPVDQDPDSNEGQSNEEEVSEFSEIIKAASIKNRIALGDRAGLWVRKVGSFGVPGDAPMESGPRCATLGGFSLHANTAVKEDQKERLEQLCRYVARPPIAEGRLSETSSGNVLYRFKKEWSDGSQAVVFSPTEFIEKLMALIPDPRVHLTRYHGLLAPNHRLRAQVVPKPPPLTEIEVEADGEKRTVISDPRRLKWAELLKRVFQIDLTQCSDCGGVLKFIAAIMKREVVCEILKHLNLPTEAPEFFPARAPPQMGFSDYESA